MSGPLEKVIPRRRISNILKEVFSNLEKQGAISCFRGLIDSAGLNIHDRPWITHFIPTIVEDLLKQVRDAQIDFDAVVGIPTGGEAWAEVFAKSANVPLCELDAETFSVIDEQKHLLPPRSRLILIDDTLFQGHTSDAALDVLTEAEYKVVAATFPVTIGNLGRYRLQKRGIPIFITYDCKP